MYSYEEVFFLMGGIPNLFSEKEILFVQARLNKDYEKADLILKKKSELKNLFKTKEEIEEINYKLQEEQTEK